jgi:hypothetical protein
MNIDYSLEADLTIRKIKDELFIFDRKSGRVHTFNSTGSFIWQLIEQKKTYSEIISAIVHQFEISNEISQLDVLQFFSELENKQLIKLANVR